MLKRVNFTAYNYAFLGILLLSGFSHLWNAVGFPDIFFDEGVYMRRSMHVLSGLGPQEAYYHDHPFFGQIFLAAILGLIGFPNSLNISADPNSISLLYLIPRIIMGVLAIVDTFLIYKITDVKYGKKIALISSLLFAVMPMTWLVRRILLDSILLPFLLSSILLALRTKNSTHKKSMVLFSGICLGLAIFTKITAFTAIPLVAGIIFFNMRNTPKTLILWILPVILIPFLWPLQAINANQFDLWIQDVMGQTQRHSLGLPYISQIFLQFDPILFVLGVAGMIFAATRKDYFLLAWIIPFVIFLVLIGYIQYFYWIPVLPVFCISAAMLVGNVFTYVRKEKLAKILTFSTVAAIAVFGIISTALVITTNMSDSEFQTASYVIKNINGNDTTILASSTYSWIFNYVFHKANVSIDYSLVLFQPIETQKVLLVADPHLIIDLGRGQKLQQVYNDTKTIAKFDGSVSKYDTSKYPYTNLYTNEEGGHIEIRIK